MQPPETSFQRANRIANEAKARKRREYEAMRQQQESEGRTLKAMFTDFDLALRPVLVEFRVGASRRSTKEGRIFDQVYMRLRPTEDEAFIVARGEDGDRRLITIRQEPRFQLRYCYGCKSHHPLADFDFIRHRYPQPSGHVRIPPGHRWYCRAWLARYKAKRAA